MATQYKAGGNQDARNGIIIVRPLHPRTDGGLWFDRVLTAAVVIATFSLILWAPLSQ